MPDPTLTTASLPWCRKAWSWLGLRVLGHNVLLETVAARTFLWGAAQTLVDNARAAEAGQAAVGALQAGGVAAGRRSMRSVLAGFLPPQRRAFERAGELYCGAVPPSNSLVDRLRWEHALGALGTLPKAGMGISGGEKWPAALCRCSSGQQLLYLNLCAAEC